MGKPKNIPKYWFLLGFSSPPRHTKVPKLASTERQAVVCSPLDMHCSHLRAARLVGIRKKKGSNGSFDPGRNGQHKS